QGDLTVNYTCSRSNGNTLDPIDVEVHFGNSCDGYHALNSNPSGSVTDFGSYVPCLYKSQLIKIFPQESALSLDNVSYNQVPCGIEFDFDAISLDQGEVSLATISAGATP